MASLVLDEEKRAGDLGEISLSFIRYWRQLTKKEIIPAQKDLDLHDVYKYAPHFFIHEIIAPDNIKIILAGTEIVNRYGHEVTGRNYLEYVKPEMRDRVYSSFKQMSEFRVGLYSKFKTESLTQEYLEGESIGFPIKSNSTEKNYLLFLSNLNVRYRPLYDPKYDIKYVHIPERLYIDIGAGVPETMNT